MSIAYCGQSRQDHAPHARPPGGVRHRGCNTLLQSPRLQPRPAPVCNTLLHPYFGHFRMHRLTKTKHAIGYPIPYCTSISAGQHMFSIGYRHLACVRAYTHARAGALRSDTQRYLRCVQNLRWGGGSGGRSAHAPDRSNNDRPPANARPAAGKRRRLRCFASQPGLGRCPKPKAAHQSDGPRTPAREIWVPIDQQAALSRERATQAARSGRVCHATGRGAR